MKCQKCQTDNSDTRKFCRECGARLLLLCSECGLENTLGDNFCGQCGHDLREALEATPIDYSQPQSYTPKYLAEKILTTRSSVEGERKVVTVLFADVANYTSISEKLDPEEVHQIMDGCFKILMDEIHKYEGTINQFTGDGVMALFGAPVAHEDHGQRACHAALAIQKAIGEYEERVKHDCGVEFRMRVGLNSGLVIVGTIGDDLKMEYTAVGDTTNLASRMETMAAPGTVWVSGNTHKLIRDFFEFKSLGKVRVKGKKVPQEAYKLGRARGVETRIQAAEAKGLTKFVGRSREMEALRVAFDKARAGSGQVAGVTGDAGVGKSRVLLEFKNTLPRGEHTYLEGRCLHYGESVVYWPILGILKSCFEIQEGDQEQRIRRKVRERLTQLDEKLVHGLAPLQDVLSLRVEDEAYLQIDPQQRRQRIFEAVRDLLLRLSQEKPLVLAIEDLHWVDRTSQGLLDFFAGALANAPILLILLYRPEYSHAEASKAYSTEIVLDQLSVKRRAELVHAILEDGEVEPELRDLVLGKAGGNPLFVEELTSSLLENGSIQKKDNQFVLTRKLSEIEVPDTIQGIIAARMDRLEENLKRTMQVASVIGREFSCRILSALNEMRQDLKGSLLSLQGLGFIYERQLFPELEYVFKHALTHEVAYNSLLLKRRRELHEKIGEAIEQIYADRLEEYYELLAYHYVQSNNKQKAIEYLDLANQKAATANAVEDAKGYFDKAMELLDTLPETEENRQRRISLLVNQSNVFFLLLKYPEYYDLLISNEPLAAGLDNPGSVGAFYTRLGWSESIFGHFDQAIQTLSKATRLSEPAGNLEETGFSLFFLAYTHLMKSDYDRVFELQEHLLRTMKESFNLRCFVRGLTSASQAYAHLGRWDEAVEAGEKALRSAQDYLDASMIAFAEVSLSAVHTYKRDMGRAIECAQLALERARTPADRLMGQQFLAWALCHGGEPHKGIEILAGILPLYQAVGFIMNELWCASFLADGYWLAGEYDKGRQTAEKLLGIAQGRGARYCIGYAYRILGEIALNNSPEESAPHFEKAISIFHEIKAENELALAYSGMGRYHKQQGNAKQAREYLTKALEIFERLGTLLEPDKVRRELGELPQ